MKTVKINIKMPHVKRKITIESKFLLIDRFCNSTLKIE